MANRMVSFLSLFLGHSLTFFVTWRKKQELWGSEQQLWASEQKFWTSEQKFRSSEQKFRENEQKFRESDKKTNRQVPFLNNVIVRGIWEKKLGTRLYYIIQGCWIWKSWFPSEILSFWSSNLHIKMAADFHKSLIT